MSGEPPGGASPGAPGDTPGEWVSVAEAARRLGITPRAVRNRVKHRSLQARPKGNSGREVFLPEAEASPVGSPGVSGGDQGTGEGEAPRDVPGTVGLMVQVARLEERLAAAGVREADLRATVADLRAALERERRPWLARVLEAIRRRS